MISCVVLLAVVNLSRIRLQRGYGQSTLGAMREEIAALRRSIEALEEVLLKDAPLDGPPPNSLHSLSSQTVFATTVVDVGKTREPPKAVSAVLPSLRRRDNPSTPQLEKLHRDDGRCGSQYPLPDGRPAQCNPWEFPCCATSGRLRHPSSCAVALPTGCKNYAVADCVTRTHCGKDTSCEPIVVEPAEDAERIIVIASAWIGPQKRFTDAKRNHVRYALKHGYGYFAVECNWSDRGFPHWSKLLIARHLLEGHGLSRAPEYLFWMDADSLFMNPSIRIEDHLVTPNPTKDFIFSGEREMVINTGHFLLRKSQWSLDFLKEVYRMYPSPGFVEQGSVIAYLAGATSKDPLEVQKAKFNRLMVSSVSPADAEKAQSLFPEQIRSHVQVMAMKAMNSYLNIYTKGDWILHFSGVSDKRSATAKTTGGGGLEITSACGYHPVPDRRVQIRYAPEASWTAADEAPANLDEIIHRVD
ncbi:hypothetical protein FOZ62_023535 [Perkinsus olseni]|uniref:Nucleotide-diphospho-sugar transferase domain-containing protein n=1 Tax=Perkinsus olseni TaxID=32597 RepID=A0A7J6TXZ6_PEROL|nr:hypothetical protein FOZ62_023535 [Perkinsus olseni]